MLLLHCRKDIAFSNVKDSHAETDSVNLPNPTVKDVIDTDKTSKATTDSRSKSEFDKRVATYSISFLKYIVHVHLVSDQYIVV